MRTLPFSFLRSAGGIWTPASLAWSSLFLPDYAGAPWVGAASAGDSSGRNLTTLGSDPATATAVNGHTPADFAGLKKLSCATSSVTLLGASGGGTWATLFYDPAPVAAIGTGRGYENGNILTDSVGAYTSFNLTAKGLAATIYNAGYADAALVPYTASRWHLGLARFDGAVIQTRVDDGSWTSTSATFLPSGGGTVRVGSSYSALSFPGQMLLLGTIDSAISDGNADALLSWARAYSAQPLLNPTIASITPNSGPQAGGTTVTIVGTNLQGVATVTGTRFGADSGGNLISNDGTTLVVTTTPTILGAGVKDVTIICDAGTVVVTGGWTFT